ncbi:MAG: DUF3955 domain-containing protein [Gemmatimonadales bacterium]|nr:DUF3955 domain-containing protein [Gemmatimonadales bacterium]MBP7620114.1 DUF3955 domain-containing protein [Gemmatimonadales bacterium]
MTDSAQRQGGVTTVFTTVDTNAMIMAKLMLEVEGIAIIASGEGLQDLFGMGRSVGAFNPVVGPMRIQVATEEAERAREVLAEMAAATPEPEEATADIVAPRPSWRRPLGILTVVLLAIVPAGLIAFRTIGSTVDAEGTIIEPFYPIAISAVAFFAAVITGVAYFISVQRDDQRR